jgi:two-component system, NtrC family, response regulator
MATALIIDDDQSICEILVSFIHSLGHQADFALTLREGPRKAASGAYDLVFLDVRLPDGNGLAAVPEIREVSSRPEVIIITGEGSRAGAKMAMESGCWDYVLKPLSIETIKLPFIRALQYREQKASSATPRILERKGIVGESEPLKACLHQVAQAAQTEANVLINGETGTGKELLARAIHENSRRAGKPLVIVDCPTLPESLVESTLFGHVRGAFTGADRDRDGLIKEADGGTLFLDEVGDMPLRVQAALLRVLQEHRFRPLGEKQEIHSNFRLIAATNRDLDQMVQAGLFRKDLLFRINSITIHLPPLRKRPDDIMDLTLHFLKQFNQRYGISIKGISPDFYEALLRYDWPGNVRELVNALERAVSLAREAETLYPVHLPSDIRSKLKSALFRFKPPADAGLENRVQSPRSIPRLHELIQTTEKKYLEDLIELCGGDLKTVCRLSGLARTNLYTRLKKYRICPKP